MKDQEHETVRLFAAVCFLALTDHHRHGWEKYAHPSYILEKLAMLDDAPTYTMGALDMENQQRVLAYYKLWQLKLPEVVQKYAETLSWGVTE